MEWKKKVKCHWLCAENSGKGKNMFQNEIHIKFMQITIS